MTPKNGLDETSMVIGELRSSVKNIEDNQIRGNDAIFKELRDIKTEQKATNEKLSAQKSKIAWISGTVSALVAYFLVWIKGGGN